MAGIFDMLAGSSPDPYTVNGQDWQTTQQMLTPEMQMLLAHHGLRMPTAMPPQQQPAQGQQAGHNAGALFGQLLAAYNQGGQGQVAYSPMPSQAQYLGQDVGQPWMQGLQGYGTI